MNLPRLHPDDRALLEQILNLLKPQTITCNNQPLDPGQQMIALARQGRIAESKQIPKTLMARSKQK